MAHILLNTASTNSERARFTNSLHQRKPCFGVKKLLSGFTKDMQWKICMDSSFCSWPHCICICRSFPFRHSAECCLWILTLLSNHWLIR